MRYYDCLRLPVGSCLLILYFERAQFGRLRYIMVARSKRFQALSIAIRSWQYLGARRMSISMRDPGASMRLTYSQGLMMEVRELQ
jgi:hypothetical protein